MCTKFTVLTLSANMLICSYTPGIVLQCTSGHLSHVSLCSPEFLVPCCTVRYDFRVKTMFDSF